MITRLDINASNADFGILVGNGSSVFIDGSEGILVTGAGNTGITVGDSSSLVIDGSTAVVISDNVEVGVGVETSSSATLNNFDITGSDTGVLVDRNSSATLHEGTIEYDLVGVFCGFSGFLEIDVGEINFVNNGGDGDTDNVEVDDACHLIGDASPPPP